ncbi:MAG TPA: amidase, partial [Hyphomicrobiaceae bacterium]|nr:amidase [Hyphomicrobiaceae bacterium]
MMRPSRRQVLSAGAAMMMAGAVGRGRGALAQQAPAAGNSGWSYRSARDLAAALKKRELSAVELLEQVIARVEALDGRLNAVVVRDFERARAAAKAADLALGRGEERALTGIPM